MRNTRLGITARTGVVAAAALLVLSLVGCTSDFSPTASPVSLVTTKGKPPAPTPQFNTEMTIEADNGSHVMDAGCSGVLQADDSGDPVIAMANWREDTPCAGFPFWVGNYEMLLVTADVQKYGAGYADITFRLAGYQDGVRRGKSKRFSTPIYTVPWTATGPGSWDFTVHLNEPSIDVWLNATGEVVGTIGVGDVVFQTN